MLWIKTFHIVAVVSWFARASVSAAVVLCITPNAMMKWPTTFLRHGKRLFWRIMTPAATAAVALGLALLGFEYRRQLDYYQNHPGVGVAGVSCLLRRFALPFRRRQKPAPLSFFTPVQ